VRGSRASIVGLVVAAVAAGCGSSPSSDQAGLTNGQAQALVSQLEAARSAAAARDVAGTEAAIDKFRRSIARLRRSGTLSDATARSLRVGAARVLARVRSDSKPPPAPPATAPAPVPPGQKKKHDAEKNHKGKGRGHHGDEEGGD
jgi:hypothetical protein